METLPELKRRLRVGTKIMLTYHKYGAHDIVGVERFVTKVAPSFIELGMPHCPSSRLTWPLPPDLEFFEDDRDFAIWVKGVMVMKYRILSR